MTASATPTLLLADLTMASTFRNIIATIWKRMEKPTHVSIDMSFMQAGA